MSLIRVNEVGPEVNAFLRNVGVIKCEVEELTGESWRRMSFHLKENIEAVRGLLDECFCSPTIAFEICSFLYYSAFAPTAKENTGTSGREIGH